MCKQPPMKFSDLRSWHNLHVGGFKFEIDPTSGTVFINETGSMSNDEDDETIQTEKFIAGINFNHYSAEKMAVLFTEMAKNMKEEHRLAHIEYEAKKKKQKADTAKRKKAALAGKKSSKTLKAGKAESKAEKAKIKAAKKKKSTTRKKAK